MVKNIVVLCDGTGQDGDAKSTSNVRVLYDDMDLARPDVQVAGYFKGVGTQSGMVAALFGNLMGFGTSARIRQAYKYLSETYEDGDRIYLLGFSRGAYTARSLAGMIHHVGGLLKPEYRILEKGEMSQQHDFSPDVKPEDSKTKQFVVRTDDVKYAYTFYSKHDNKNPPVWSDTAPERVPVEIHFLGVYDTVGALGLPHFNLLSFLNFIPQLFNRAVYGYHDVKLHRGIKIARHALAIDELRQDFAADVWKPIPEVRDSEQRWFAGCHSDIGGSYVGDAAQLSNTSYIWMTGEAEKAGLQLDQLKTKWGEGEPEPPSPTLFQVVMGWGQSVVAWIKGCWSMLFGTAAPAQKTPVVYPRTYELNPFASRNAEEMPPSRNHYYRPIMFPTKTETDTDTETNNCDPYDQTIAREVFSRLDKTDYVPPGFDEPVPPYAPPNLLLVGKHLELSIMNRLSSALFGKSWEVEKLVADNTAKCAPLLQEAREKAQTWCTGNPATTYAKPATEEELINGLQTELWCGKEDPAKDGETAATELGDEASSSEGSSEGGACLRRRPINAEGGASDE